MRMQNQDNDGPVRAVALLSGGLDSQLAVCVLREQGVGVHGVVFDSPFFHVDAARAASQQLNLPLTVLNFTSDILTLLDNPPHGFGRCMNPCIDCHALMLRRAGEFMPRVGASFLATGEVLDERPKSQNYKALGTVSEASGFADLILRPLSARLLPPTKPEREGWVDRESLLDLQGRTRRRQFELAERYGIEEYPTPAGGCRLTEPNFCNRLRDLKEHEGLDGERSLMLLRYGRHFRIDEGLKLIVGRNEHDNAVLEGTAELYDIILKSAQVPGPTAILPFTAREDQVRLGARICARYSDSTPGEPTEVKVRTARGSRLLRVSPVADEEIERLRI